MALEFATQDDNTILWQRGVGADRALKLAKDAGIDWVRLNIFSSAQKGSGWPIYDDAVNRCIAAGINVQLTFSGQPDWDLKKDDGGVSYKNPDPTEFAAFCVRCVKHFNGRVDRFSLFNEPNHPAFMEVTSGNAGVHYGKLYRAAYAKVRKIAPKAQIFFGELSGRDGAQAFLRDSVKGHSTFASGMAIHPYQYQTPPAEPKPGDNYQWGHLPALRDHLNAYAKLKWIRTRSGRPLPIYVTEFGYFVEGEKRGIPEGRRAAYTGATIEMARKWGIRQYLYYHLIEVADGWNTGIVSIDGQPSSTYNEIKARS